MLIDKGHTWREKHLEAWPRVLGLRPRERHAPRTINNKIDNTKDPTGEDVPEEWRGQLLRKGEGTSVYRGPRALPPKRTEVGRAVFGEARPSEEWGSYQSRLEEFYQD